MRSSPSPCAVVRVTEDGSSGASPPLGVAMVRVALSLVALWKWASSGCYYCVSWDIFVRRMVMVVSG